MTHDSIPNLDPRPRAGDWVRALELLDEMKADRFVPSATLIRGTINACEKADYTKSRMTVQRLYMELQALRSGDRKLRCVHVARCTLPVARCTLHVPRSTFHVPRSTSHIPHPTSHLLPPTSYPLLTTY